MPEYERRYTPFDGFHVQVTSEVDENGIWTDPPDPAMDPAGNVGP
jgi:hypothetical protein